MAPTSGMGPKKVNIKELACWMRHRLVEKSAAIFIGFCPGLQMPSSRSLRYKNQQWDGVLRLSFAMMYA